MNRQGFVDANGYGVEIGTLVEYQDKRFAEVTDVTQDGDVTLQFLDGEVLHTKWRYVARLSVNIAGQLHAMQARIVQEYRDAEALSSKPANKVAGYTPQSDDKVKLVNEFKADEERLLRKLDKIGLPTTGFSSTTNDLRHDQRWLAIARSHFQEGFMALNRAVFQPTRIKLPEDGE